MKWSCAKPRLTRGIGLRGEPGGPRGGMLLAPVCAPVMALRGHLATCRLRAPFRRSCLCDARHIGGVVAIQRKGSTSALWLFRDGMSALMLVTTCGDNGDSPTYWLCRIPAVLRSTRVLSERLSGQRPKATTGEVRPRVSQACLPGGDLARLQVLRRCRWDLRVCHPAAGEQNPPGYV